MEAMHPEEIKKHVRVYVLVFAALAVLTVVTVILSYLHLPIKQAIAVALLIASVKGSLVALFFMHLISEKQVVLAILVVAALFMAVLLLIPVLSYA